MLKPIKFTCADHQGADQARVQQWDGKAWKIISDFYTADEKILAPMVKEHADKYAKEKKITPRDCAKAELSASDRRTGGGGRAASRIAASRLPEPEIT